MYNAKHKIDWTPEGGEISELGSIIEGLDAYSILCGPEGDPDSVVIDPVFEKSFEQLMEDLRVAAGVPEADHHRDLHTVGSPMRDWVAENLTTLEPLMQGDDGFYRIVELDIDGVDYGVAHLYLTCNDDFDITGLMIGADIAVDKYNRGHGIGAGMIAARLIATGELPTWNHDKPGYTDMGAECVRSGLRLSQKLVNAKEIGEPEQENLEP